MAEKFTLVAVFCNGDVTVTVRKLPSREAAEQALRQLSLDWGKVVSSEITPDKQ